VSFIKTCSYCRLFIFFEPLVVFEPTGQLVDRRCYRFLTWWNKEAFKAKLVQAAIIAQRRSFEMAQEDAEATDDPTEVEMMLRVYAD